MPSLNPSGQLGNESSYIIGIPNMTVTTRLAFTLLAVSTIVGCSASVESSSPAPAAPSRGPSELNVIAGPDDMTTADIGFVQGVRQQKTGLADDAQIIEAGYQVCQYQHNGYSQTEAESALSAKYPNVTAHYAKVVVLDVLTFDLCTRGGSAGLVG